MASRLETERIDLSYLVAPALGLAAEVSDIIEVDGTVVRPQGQDGPIRRELEVADRSVAKEGLFSSPSLRNTVGYKEKEWMMASP